MNNAKISLYRSALRSSSVLVAAASIAMPALAQEQEQEAATAEEVIVVTGSLIQNPNLERSSPVNVTTSDEIELLQSNVAEDILREIPGIVPSIGSSVNNGNGGSSFVNLRGLGSNRNIVILDGQRVVPADLVGRFDLNNVPVALVERVDVLTGGSSTTYGADAISGVVNFITKRDFAGAEFNISNQLTEEGDGNYFRVDATLGANFDDGRGNATLSIGYQEADAIYQGARPISYDTVETYGGGLIGSGTSVPTRLSVVGGGTQQIDPATGTLVPTYQTFNFNPANIFQTPFERFNMFGTARYEISDAVEVYTRGLFSKNTVSTIIAPSGSFGIGVQIPISNPFLPTGVRNTLCLSNIDLNPLPPETDPETGEVINSNITRPTQAQCDAAAVATDPNDPDYLEATSAMFRRSTEVGPRTSDYTTTIFDYQLGFRGDITDTIRWDVSGSYGESERVQIQGGYTLNSRVRQSLLTTVDDAGNVVCQDTSNGCVPTNWFGAEGTISPESVAFLTGESTVQTKTTLAQIKGTISGDFGAASPWADEPIAFAVGGEYREYTASQVSDLLSQSGDLGGAGGAAPNIDGGYNVYEAIAEVIVPLVQGKPFFENLTLEAGVRYSDYEVDAPGTPTFDTWTYKIGGTWEPGAGVTIRGNYARSVRAPNISELFSPVNTVLTNLGDDPCASVDGEGNPIPGRGTPTGELLAVCLAQGAPSSTIGSIEQPISGQANAAQGGSIDLKPEKSDSYTIGVVLQPEFVPGFTMSVDYYNIKVRNAISFPTPGDVIAACFGTADANGNYTNVAAGASSTAACTNIGRDPITGGLSGDPATTSGLYQISSNSGSLDTDGIDLRMDWRGDIGFAELALSFVGNYTFNSKFNAFVDSPISVNRECVSYISANCGSLQPEYQWSQRTTLSFDSVDVSLLWRHISSFKQEPLDVEASGPFYQGTVDGFGDREFDFGKIKAYNYFDLSSRFGITDNVSLTLTVQNLLNKKPPLTGNNAGSTAFNSGNTFPSTYDALGRRYGVAARLRF